MPADDFAGVQQVAVTRVERRKHSRAGGTFSVLKECIKTMFSSGNSGDKRKKDAMKFASSNKRSGKKGRRLKRIALYAGGGIVVVAVLLVFVLAPNGEVALTQAAVAKGVQTAVPTEEKSPEVDTSNTSRGINSGLISDNADIVDTSNVAYVGESLVPAVTHEADTGQTAAPIETTPPDVTTTPIDINELVTYFRVEADLYYNKVGYSTNHYDYTDNDIYMLAQVIDSEARGESFKGKVAVGNVVMNRVLLRGYFGSTVSAVITAGDQFAYSSGRKPSSESRRAARSVLQDENWVIPQYVYYFHSTRPAGVDWASHKFFTEIGNHCFYTHNYYGRSRINSVPPPLFDRTYQWPQLGCKPEDRVYRIQYMLNKLGYDVYADKYFGQDTKDAIKAFQEKKGLEADGVAGPSTIKALINAFGLVEYYQKFCV